MAMFRQTRGQLLLIVWRLNPEQSSVKLEAVTGTESGRSRSMKWHFGHTSPGNTGQTRELPGLSIHATRRPADTQVLVRGRLCMNNAHALHDLAINCLSQDRPLVIDIKEAISSDSAGAAVLLKIFAVARENGCVLAIVNPVPAVKKMLVLLRLEGVLPLYPSVAPG